MSKRTPLRFFYVSVSTLAVIEQIVLNLGSVCVHLGIAHSSPWCHALTRRHNHNQQGMPHINLPPVSKVCLPKPRQLLLQLLLPPQLLMAMAVLMAMHQTLPQVSTYALSVHC